MYVQFPSNLSPSSLFHILTHSPSLPPQPEAAAVTSTTTPEDNTPPSTTDRDSWPNEWTKMSTYAVGENVCIWRKFLQQLFFDRTKVLYLYIFNN